MAAFTFPEGPSNGATVTNSATGITYIFVSLPAPGKWEVKMEAAPTDFVDIAGDTMTGPLDIIPSAPILGTSADASFMVQSSPFSTDASTQNYVSRVLDAKSNQGHTIFGIRDSDAANLPITQGRISAVTSYAADTLVQPSLNSITADDFPSDGLRAGFRIGGRIQGGSTGDVLDCTYFKEDGTQINYYGDMLTDNSLVTKKFVDDAIAGVGAGDALPLTGGTMTGQIAFNMGSGDPINVNSSNFKVGYNGAVNMKAGFTLADGNMVVNTGNITAKQGPPNAAGEASSTGRLYTKTNDGTTNFTAFPNGSLQIGQNISFAGTQQLKQFNGYNNDSPEFVFKLGSTSQTATEVARISGLGTILQGGLDVEGINGAYAAQLKGDVFFPQSTTMNVTGASNANFGIYVGETNASSTRQVAIYQGNIFFFGDVSAYENLSASKKLDVAGKLTCTAGGTFGGSGASVDYLFNGGTATFMNSGVKNYSGLWQQNKDTSYLLGNNAKLTFYADTSTSGDVVCIVDGKNKYVQATRVTGLASPTVSTDATNKLYVDGALGSLGGNVGSDGTVTNLPFLRKDGGVMTGNIVFNGGALVSNSNANVTHNLSDAHYLKGSVQFNKTSGDNIVKILNSGQVTIARKGNSAQGFKLFGQVVADGPADGDLLFAYHNGGATIDAVNYNGKTNSSNNLQTKTSVDAAIAAAVTKEITSLRAKEITVVNAGSGPIQDQIAGAYQAGSGSPVSYNQYAGNWNHHIDVYNASGKGAIDFSASAVFDEDRIVEVFAKQGNQVYFKGVVNRGYIVGNFFRLMIKKALFGTGDTSTSSTGNLGANNGTFIIVY